MFKFTIVLLIASTLLNKAYALNLQSYQFTDSYRYAVLEDSLKEMFPGKYVFTGSYGHVQSPLYFSDTYLHHHRKSIIDSNHILTAGFTYYLSSDLALGAGISGVNNNVFNESHTTLGDTTLKAIINLKRTKSFSFSLNPQVYLPTGKEENFSTMGSVSGALNLVAEKSISQKFHLLASIGGLSSKDNRYADVDHRQLLLTQLGLSYDISEKLNLNIEAFRKFPLVNDTLQDEGKYLLTAKHKTTNRVSTYFGGGLSGFEEVQRRSLSAFVGLKFHEALPVAMIAQEQVERKTPTRPREHIYFEHDSYNLDQEDERRLQEYAHYLNDYLEDSQTVILEGHASAPGSEAYNYELSRKRAQEVKNHLMNYGFRSEQLVVRPLGETTPEFSDDARNRRVKFQFNK